jgi:hypothetical protein
MTTKFTNCRYIGERIDWEHGEHSGTITFPGEERGPVDIQWDNECPDDWQAIEEIIEKEASIHLGRTEEETIMNAPKFRIKPDGALEITTGIGDRFEVINLVNGETVGGNATHTDEVRNQGIAFGRAGSPGDRSEFKP